MSVVTNATEQRNLENASELRILLVGKTGEGKSAAGNIILGKEAFKAELSSSSVTSECQKEKVQVSGRRVAVIDTPGLFDTTNTNEEIIQKIKLSISLSAPGPHVILVVLQLGRFTDEEQKTVELIQQIFKNSSEYIMVLFTHGDKLEQNKITIKQYINKNKDLVTFIESTSGLYHVFNNKEENPQQVAVLLQQIDKLIRRNGGFYSNELLEEAEKAIQEEQERLQKESRLDAVQARERAERDNPFLKTAAAVGFGLAAVAGESESLRLVLVGSQSVGKSASGNTILGRKGFESVISSSAVTLQSESRKASVWGRSVMVVDTPGLFNNQLSDDELKQEMEKALTLCHPGPHVFLIVIQLGRFTEQERSVMKKLSDVLEPKVNQYCMVLFTFGDKLEKKPIDQFVKEDENLLQLINQCGGHYHVFNNTDPELKDQVRELLKKIDNQIKNRKKQPWFEKGKKNFIYSWTKMIKILCIALPVVISGALWLAYKKP